MNFAKPISNAISYARKEPVGAATVLIALDLAKKVAASSAGATVASVVGTYAMNRAMKMSIAAGASHLDADHSVGAILDEPDPVAVAGLVEARPAAVGVELG